LGLLSRSTSRRPVFVCGNCVSGVEGVGVTNPRSTTVIVPHGDLGLRASVALGAFLELVAQLWGRASARPSVAFQGFQPIIEASWLAAEFSMGAGGHF
jgi:hypothetical protein